jgi:hypothetical protein
MKLTITVDDVLASKLKSQLYGLLCEYEKNREWESFLDSIIIELLGYPEEEKTPSYYRLFHKISSLRYLSYKYFRTTIFDCMSLISKADKDGQ